MEEESVVQEVHKLKPLIVFAPKVLYSNKADLLNACRPQASGGEQHAADPLNVSEYAYHSANTDFMGVEVGYSGNKLRQRRFIDLVEPPRTVHRVPLHRSQHRDRLGGATEQDREHQDQGAQALAELQIEKQGYEPHASGQSPPQQLSCLLQLLPDMQQYTLTAVDTIQSFREFSNKRIDMSPH